MDNQYETIEEKRKRKIKNIAFWIIFPLVLVGCVWGVVKLAQQSNQKIATFQGSIPAVTDQDHIRGDINAKAKVVEYGDYQCPACAAAEPTLKQLESDYAGKVAFVFRNFPLEMVHQNAAPAAQAVYAAGKQGKFWEMHDALYTNQSQWSETAVAQAEQMFLSYAQSLGLNPTQFQSDMNSADARNQIANDYNEALNNLKLDHTPTFFVNGKEQTDTSAAAFKQAIDSAINAQ